MLGISTCWWDNRALRGDEIVGDILELGLTGVELEYRISNTIFQQMTPWLNKELSVLSIHNFFPKPQERVGEKGSGDFFLLSSTDADERSRAVRYSVKTIEHAHDLGVRAIIFHLGRVDMQKPTEKFKRFYSDGRIVQSEGLALLNEKRHIREAKSRRNLDAVLFSLEKLNREAEQKGVFIAIENRYHFHEIPDFHEIGIILRKFEGGNVRYWHDVGHAGAQEAMGICKQKDLLDAYCEKMIGIHLHDVKGFDDHISPGQGQIDYREVMSFMKPSLIKILEIHSKVERKELEKGVQFVKNFMEPQVKT
jgi:sugar phosphate isomerase/epimerase